MEDCDRSFAEELNDMLKEGCAIDHFEIAKLNAQLAERLATLLYYINENDIDGASGVLVQLQRLAYEGVEYIYTKTLSTKKNRHYDVTKTKVQVLIFSLYIGLLYKELAELDHEEIKNPGLHIGMKRLFKMLREYDDIVYPGDLSGGIGHGFKVQIRSTRTRLIGDSFHEIIDELLDQLVKEEEREDECVGVAIMEDVTPEDAVKRLMHNLGVNDGYEIQERVARYRSAIYSISVISTLIPLYTDTSEPLEMIVGEAAVRLAYFSSVLHKGFPWDDYTNRESNVMNELNHIMCNNNRTMENVFLADQFSNVTDHFRFVESNNALAALLFCSYYTPELETHVKPDPADFPYFDKGVIKEFYKQYGMGDTAIAGYNPHPNMYRLYSSIYYYEAERRFKETGKRSDYDLEDVRSSARKATTTATKVKKQVDTKLERVKKPIFTNVDDIVDGIVTNEAKDDEEQKELREAIQKGHYKPSFVLKKILGGVSKVTMGTMLAGPVGGALGAFLAYVDFWKTMKRTRAERVKLENDLDDCIEITNKKIEEAESKSAKTRLIKVRQKLERTKTKVSTGAEKSKKKD